MVDLAHVPDPIRQVSEDPEMESMFADHELERVLSKGKPTLFECLIDGFSYESATVYAPRFDHLSAPSFLDQEVSIDSSENKVSFKLSLKSSMIFPRSQNFSNRFWAGRFQFPDLSMRKFLMISPVF